MMSNCKMLDKTIATDESFWSMLSKPGKEFSIYIPQIQRDYAQGRTDVAATQIREKFVDDLFDSFVNHAEDGKILDINFIYGNIEDENCESRFVPIDGQQRLTTLFLLHWYFAVYSGKIDSDPEVQKRLLQFKYETRNVTGKFCKNLTKYVRINFQTLDPSKKISDEIKNYYWFFSDFDNNPSIKAMLVMLDAIHSKAKEYLAKGISLDNVFDILTSEKAPIRFLYLNIDDAGLTDSIYIKMNARGKALTHFENFKAQLRNYLSCDETFAEKFIDNVNGTWSQFFWTPEYRRTVKSISNGDEIRETSFDMQMMKFFRFCMLMDYIVNVDSSETINNRTMIRYSLTELSKEQDYLFTSRLFKDGFRCVYNINCSKAVLSVKTFKKINKLLNVLAKRQKQIGSIIFTENGEYNKQYIDEKQAFLKLIGTSFARNLTNEEQIILYAEYAFLIRYANDNDTFDKEKELSRWLRLISNLVAPTLNLQLDVFFNMIRSIHAMIEDGSALNCDEYMSRLLRRNYRQSAMSVFTETQVVEESIKSILMKVDTAWKSAISISEKTFMEGQTGALFAFSGLTEEYKKQISEFEEKNKDANILPKNAQILAQADSNSAYYSQFIKYLNKFILLFDANGVRSEIENKALFRRALLCYGGKDSYMLPPGKSRQSFLDNKDRDYGFKRLLRDDNSGKRVYLKMLMDDININEAIDQQLQTIIDRKTFSEDERWKMYFVKVPEILDSVASDTGKKDPDGQWVFSVPQRFIRKNNNDDILLLSRTQTNSVNRELYSYVLYLKARKNALQVKYHAEYTDGAEKYAYYTNKQGKQVFVEYKKRENVGYIYVAKMIEDTEVFCCNSIADMLDYIKKTIGQDEKN